METKSLEEQLHDFFIENEGKPVSTRYFVIWTAQKNTCFNCKHKALKLMDRCFECLGKTNLGAYIDINLSNNVTCLDWEEIENGKD